MATSVQDNPQKPGLVAKSNAEVNWSFEIDSTERPAKTSSEVMMMTTLECLDHSPAYLPCIQPSSMFAS